MSRLTDLIRRIEEAGQGPPATATEEANRLYAAWERHVAG